MDAFLQLPPPRRLLAFQQVDAEMGLQAVSLEKDFRVCWTLREVFALPGIVNTSPSNAARRSPKRGSSSNASPKLCELDAV